jgi:hypothetical protein
MAFATAQRESRREGCNARGSIFVFDAEPFLGAAAVGAAAEVRLRSASRIKMIVASDISSTAGPWTCRLQRGILTIC